MSVYGLGALLAGLDLRRIDAAEIEAYAMLGQLNDGLMTLDTWLPADAWEAEGLAAVRAGGIPALRARRDR